MNRGYAIIGLHHPKNAINIGSVMRAVGVYGAAMLVISKRKYVRVPSDPMKGYRHTPILHVDDIKDVIPFECVPVAVDLVGGADPLPDYVHPERALYVFGPEDGTLGPDVLAWCRDIVYVPTLCCMNLAATVNVVLYDRLAKQLLNSQEATK